MSNCMLTSIIKKIEKKHVGHSVELPVPPPKSEACRSIYLLLPTSFLTVAWRIIQVCSTFISMPDHPGNDTILYRQKSFNAPHELSLTGWVPRVQTRGSLDGPLTCRGWGILFFSPDQRVLESVWGGGGGGPGGVVQHKNDDGNSLCRLMGILEQIFLEANFKWIWYR